MPYLSMSKIEFPHAATSRSQALHPVETTRQAIDRENILFDLDDLERLKGTFTPTFEITKASLLKRAIDVFLLLTKVSCGQLLTHIEQPMQAPRSRCTSPPFFPESTIIAPVGQTELHSLHSLPAQARSLNSGKPSPSSRGAQ
jgi:hypothetical protein